MGDVADCFDQETYGSCIPIDPIDGRFPVLGQYIGGVARFHAQRRYCARWRPHDRLFDRIETRIDSIRCVANSSKVCSPTLVPTPVSIVACSGGCAAGLRYLF